MTVPLIGGFDEIFLYFFMISATYSVNFQMVLRFLSFACLYVSFSPRKLRKRRDNLSLSTSLAVA